MKDCRLYVIIDADLIGKRDISLVAEKAIKGGADIIQLRDKLSCDKVFLNHARKLRKVTKKYKRLFIVNDRVDIAKLVDADGVHIGQRDLPIRGARAILGKKMIGVSCRRLSEARRSDSDGADYIGIGPVFKTNTKKSAQAIGLKVLKEVAQKVGIEKFAIGGVNLKNLDKIKKTGISNVVVASAITQKKDITLAAKKIKDKLLK